MYAYLNNHIRTMSSADSKCNCESEGQATQKRCNV